MRLQYTHRFERAYTSLEASETVRVAKAIHLLAGDSRHPGLRVKKVQGTSDIWEARASHSLRLTFEIHEDLLILRNVGPHDRVLENPWVESAPGSATIFIHHSKVHHSALITHHYLTSSPFHTPRGE